MKNLPCLLTYVASSVITAHCLVTAWRLPHAIMNEEVKTIHLDHRFSGSITEQSEFLML